LPAWHAEVLAGLRYNFNFPRVPFGTFSK